mmetsp:Transcript_52355/g.89920  ORF Transcript_52355/g.89920 Transcript_52355/m.89920 type:complete len:86 (+) Transcript_52355:318-575(+)
MACSICSSTTTPQSFLSTLSVSAKYSLDAFSLPRFSDEITNTGSLVTTSYSIEILFDHYAAARRSPFCGRHGLRFFQTPTSALNA